MSCIECPLNKQIRVPGDGNPNAYVAIVGEGPGPKEVLAEKPFVGPSGQMLNWLLKRAGEDRQSVYVTNAALCMPQTVFSGEKIVCGKDRALKDSTLIHCRERLLGELLAVHPKVILAVGNYALQVLTGFKGIMKRHGSLHTINLPLLAGKSATADLSANVDTFVVPMLHPAHLLRGEDKKIHAIVRVIEKAFRLSREDPREDLGTYLLVSPFHAKGDTCIDELERWVDLLIKEQAPISIDVETTVEDERKATLTVVGFGSNRFKIGVSVTLLAWNREINEFEECWTAIESLRIYNAMSKLLSSNLEKWYWNMGFDVTVLTRYYGQALRGPHRDGIHWHWAMQPDLPHSLGFACQTYLDIPAWKEEFRALQKTGKAIHDDLLRYNAQDCLYTAEVIPYLQAEVKTRKNEHLIAHQEKVAELARQCHLNGLPVDFAIWQDLHDDYSKRRDDCITKMREAIRDANAAHDLNYYLVQAKLERRGKSAATAASEKPIKHIDVTWDQFNPQSPDQARWFLFEFQGLVPDRQTAGGEERANKLPSHSYKAVLSYLANPLVKAYVEFSEHRATVAMLNTAMNATDKEISRMFVSWNSTAQKGTRWSSKPNVQNWPKDLRKIFTQPPDRCWVGADASQIEYRIAACFAGITELLERFNAPAFDEEKEPEKKYDPLYDAHSMVAAEVYGDAFLKAPPKMQAVLRTMVKRVVYALLYGAGPEKILTSLREDRHLSADLRAALSLKRITEIYTGFNARFPEWNRWAEMEVGHAMLYGYQVFAPLNRRRYWPVMKVEENKIRNTPIQLAAGDVVNILFCRMASAIRQNNLDSTFALHMHDACYWDTARKDAEQVKEIVNNLFDFQLVSPRGKVHIYGQARIGDSIADVG